MFFSNKVYKIKVNGLKPLTQHDFYFEDVKRNVDCRPDGEDLGDDLITDSRGKIEFDFHYTNSTEQSWIKSMGGLKKWAKKHLPPGLIVPRRDKQRRINIELKSASSSAKGILTVKIVYREEDGNPPSITDTGP